MKYVLYFLIYMYLSVGLIIGIKMIDKWYKEYKWYKKFGIVLFKIVFWFPNIFADVIVGNMGEGA